MNFTDWRSSTWNTTARSLVAAEPIEVEMRQHAQALARLGHAVHAPSRPSASTSRIDRSKIETSRSSLLLK